MMNNEVQRLQQLAGLNEIRINNPKKQFVVTPKGKQDSKNFNTLMVAAQNLDAGDMIWEIDEIFNMFPQLGELSRFNIILDEYGEDIIKLNDINYVDQVINDYVRIMGDEEDIIRYLKNFEKMGYITPINI